MSVEVHDRGPGSATRRHYSATSGTGRGLVLVDELAREWGTVVTATGKFVWFELAIPNGAEHARSAATHALMIELIEVRILGLPVDVYQQAAEHNDELMREFALIKGQGAGDGAAVPDRLLALVDEMRARFAGFTTQPEAELAEAAASGGATIDLVYLVPPDVATAAVDLGRPPRRGRQLLPGRRPADPHHAARRRGLPPLVPRGVRAPGRRRGADALVRLGRLTGRVWIGAHGRGHTPLMAPENRVLDAAPVETLEDYVKAGGGKALGLARKAGPEGVIGAVERSGLRGRGGAGFPTGTKWRTVSESRSASQPATVVVNAAEGEPGSFKDRAILRRNPYKVLEGALVAADAVGADAVIVAMKASFTRELARMREAIDEVKAAGWADGVELMVVEGPSHYLYGEETALLEVIAGRNPFPRIAPPFRHGVDESGPRHQVGGRRDHGRARLRHRSGADPGQQHRDPRQRAGHRGRGPGVVPVAGHRRVARHHRLHDHRPHPQARRGRVRHGHAAVGGDRRRRRRHEARPPGQRRPVGRGQRPAARRPGSTRR